AVIELDPPGAAVEPERDALRVSLDWPVGRLLDRIAGPRRFESCRPDAAMRGVDRAGRARSDLELAPLGELENVRQRAEPFGERFHRRHVVQQIRMSAGTAVRRFD